MFYEDVTAAAPAQSHEVEAILAAHRKAAAPRAHTRLAGTIGLALVLAGFAAAELHAHALPATYAAMAPTQGGAANYR